MSRVVILSVLAVAVGASTAAAQVPLTPKPIPTCDAKELEINLDELSRDYLAGAWLELHKQLKTAETALQTACVADGEQWIVFVWPGKNALGDTVLFSVVYPGVRPFSGVLPGLTSRDRNAPGLYEVFISPTRGAKLRSAYVITREDDPLLAQVSAALEKNLEKLIGGTGALVGFAGGGVRSDAPPTKPLAAVSSIGLPFERGKIVVKRRAVIPRSHQELMDEANRLARDAELREARDSQKARDLAGAHVTKLNSGLTSTACAGSQSTEDGCRSEIAKLMSAEYTTQLAAAAESERPALAAVDKRFRDHVAGISGAKIDQDASLTNEPKTHVSIGTLVGYIGTVWNEERRVKVSSSGALVEDPLPRVLTGVVINWSPTGFHASDPATPPAERFRLFTGVAITPNIGWLVGGTAQVLSGFAVNTGLALLALPTGEVGSTPESSRPFRTDWAWAPFVGAGFSWK